MEYISWCINSDYSLITQLHYLCAYMHAQNLSSISVDCRNIMPSIYIYLEFNFFFSDWLKNLHHIMQINLYYIHLTDGLYTIF